MIKVRVCLITAIWCVLAGNALASPPSPDKDLLASIRYTRTAKTPEARALRKQIARGPADLARERAAAREEGLLLDLKQLQKPLPPPDQNAAPLYVQLQNLRHSGHMRLPNYAETLTTKYTYTPEQLAAVQKVFDDDPDYVRLLHEAADRPVCVLPQGPADLPDNVLNVYPLYVGSRECARELRTESYLLAQRGRFREAIINEVRGFQVAQHDASQPTLLGFLTGIACHRMTVLGMRDTLYLSGPDAEVVDRIQKAILSHSNKLSLRYALSGDVAITLAELEPLRKGNPQTFAQMFTWLPSESKSPRKLVLTPEERRFFVNLMDAVEVRYIHTMRQLVANADKPAQTRRTAFTRLQPLSLYAQPSQEVEGIHSPLNYMLSMLMPPNLDQMDNRWKAEDEVVMAGAAVLAIKSRTGAFPQAVPPKYRDPFTDKPLPYRREGANGFVVYSVGQSGKFDGGKPGEMTRAGQSLFRYPPPAPVPVPKEMAK